MVEPHLIINTFYSSTTIQHTQLHPPPYNTRSYVKSVNVTTRMTHSKLFDTRGVLIVHSSRRIAFEDPIFLKGSILQARDTTQANLSNLRGQGQCRFGRMHGSFFVELFKSAGLVLTVPRCYSTAPLTQRMRNKKK